MGIVRLDSSLKETTEADFLSYQLPRSTWPAMRRYLFSGVEPGHFLTAVLTNNLLDSCNRADDENILLLPNYIKFLYNCVPGNAWGSAEAVTAWIENRGFMR